MMAMPSFFFFIDFCEQKSMLKTTEFFLSSPRHMKGFEEFQNKKIAIL